VVFVNIWMEEKDMDLPFRLFRPFLGARILKTGIAVFTALVIAHSIGTAYGTFAAVSAILAVQPSVVRARQQLTNQMLSNLFGGVVGALLGIWLGSSPLAMALAVILVLGLCTRLGLNETASSAVVAVLFIMDRPERDFLLYTGIRIAAIVGGSLIGYAVNRFILPPDYSARIKEQLRRAVDDVDTFVTHLLTSLASPEHYLKEQIKSEANAIKQRLDTAGYFLALIKETTSPGARLLPVDKSRASLFVFVERIMDIHKIVLQAGGLQPGPELGGVAVALKAVMAYKAGVISAALDGGEVDPAAALACTEALRHLDELTAALIDKPATRDRGLALHSVLTNIRHMSWRMDSLARLLQELA
jgi:hypothetical protein